MINKIIIILFFVNFTSYSQIQNEIKKSFILGLYEQKILISRDKETKNEEIIPNSIDIDLSFLSNYGSDFMFYSFTIGKDKIVLSDQKYEIIFNSSSCVEFVVAYDFYHKKMYKIKGFNMNDLFFLLRDIEKSLDKKKKVKRILTDLNNLEIGVNFKCIYKSLQKNNFNAECLKSCSDPKESHSDTSSSRSSNENE